MLSEQFRVRACIMQAYCWQSPGKVRAADVGTGDLRKSAGFRTPFEIVSKTGEIDASIKTLDSNRKEVDTHILISLSLDHAVIVFFPTLMTHTISDRSDEHSYEVALNRYSLQGTPSQSQNIRASLNRTSSIKARRKMRDAPMKNDESLIEKFNRHTQLLLDHSQQTDTNLHDPVGRSRVFRAFQRTIGSRSVK